MNKEPIILERLLPYLIANYSYTTGKGFMHGKMGGVLFFFMYAKYSGHEIYSDLGDMLMDDVYSSIDNEMLINFETGICGIGWGIEYMIRTGLVAGNSDEILESIDKKVMEMEPCRLQDHTFKTGLGGILFYVVARLKSFDRKGAPLPFDNYYLQNLHAAVNRPGIVLNDDNIPAETLRDFNSIMGGKNGYEIPTIPDFIFNELPKDLKAISDHPLGISKGLTGVAIKQILQ